mgnify:CR=1 FL=1
MKLSRSTACALGVRALLMLPVSPLLPLPASAFQADDKSFSLAVPPTWQLDPLPPRAGQPQRIFRVVGSCPGGGDFEATVEPSPTKRLAELGSLDAVASRYLASQPQPAVLLGATKVPRPNMFAMDMYELRFSTGPAQQAQQRVVRLGLQQSRRYELVVSLPAEPTRAIQVEAEALVASFQAFPLNIGCLRQSNAGTPLPGVCY